MPGILLIWVTKYGKLCACCACSRAWSFVFPFWSYIWTAAWQNQQNNLCAQWRLRSAWASAQSDQSSLSAWRKLGSFLPIEHIVKTLIKLGGCQADPSLCWAQRSLFWFCHVAAHNSPVLPALLHLFWVDGSTQPAIYMIDESVKPHNSQELSTYEPLYVSWWLYSHSMNGYLFPRIQQHLWKFWLCVYVREQETMLVTAWFDLSDHLTW